MARDSVALINDAAAELDIQIPSVDSHRRAVELSPPFTEFLDKEVRAVAKRIAPFLSSSLKNDKERTKILKRDLSAFLKDGFLDSVEISFNSVAETLNHLPILQRRVRILNERNQSAVKAHLQEIMALKSDEGKPYYGEVAFYEPLLYVPDEVRQLCEDMFRHANLSSRLDMSHMSRVSDERETMEGWRLDTGGTVDTSDELSSEELRKMLADSRSELEGVVAELRLQNENLSEMLAALQSKLDTESANSKSLQEQLDNALRDRAASPPVMDFADSHRPSDEEIEERIRVAVCDALAEAWMKWEAELAQRQVQVETKSISEGKAEVDEIVTGTVSQTEKELEEKLRAALKDQKVAQKEIARLKEEFMSLQKEHSECGAKARRLNDEVRSEYEAALKKKDAKITQLEDEAVALGVTVVDLQDEIKRLKTAILKMQGQVSAMGDMGEDEVASLISDLMQSCGVVVDAPKRRQRVWERLYVDFFVRMQRHERVRAMRMLAADALLRLKDEVYNEVEFIAKPPRFTRITRKRSRSPSPLKNHPLWPKTPENDESDPRTRHCLPCCLPLMPEATTKIQPLSRTVSLPLVIA